MRTPTTAVPYCNASLREGYAWKGQSAALAVEGVQLHDFTDVVSGLRVRRYAAVAQHRVLASVVGGAGEAQVELEGLQELAHVAHAAGDILAGVEHVVDAEALSSGRHQLHQALRALGRNCLGIERRFGVD